MVGILGVGGIGKTTIAKEIYNLIAYQFEGSCFLANVRETAKREYSLVQLQETLLSEILGDSRSLKVGNVDRGINVIKYRLCSKRVLLILDDVDQSIQLETLAGELNWFGLGSRIIITTRDEKLLTNPPVELMYKVKELDHNEALQLFCWNAFKRDKPFDDYVELTERIIHYARGLPLALTVLGSDLHGRSINEWKSALDKYKRCPNKSIQEILIISYDGLDDNEKDIFLDIACFFKGKPADYVIKILDGCGFSSVIGIKVLMEKSLITIDKPNKFVMHDLLQEMGREIVRQESPEEPGERSRLWFHEDICHVLEEHTNFQNLTAMDVSSCQFLTKIPDLSRIPNLEELTLDNCTSLVEVYHSVGLLDKLVILRLVGCSNLTSFPKTLKLRSLEHLMLEDCVRLQNFPEIECKIERLGYIGLKCTPIKELPSSIGYAIGLQDLNLEGCENLMNLPSTIHQLQRLKRLSLRDCSKLVKFPQKVGDNGLSMPSIVSTKESEIFSSAELISFPPPLNSCICNDDLSWSDFVSIHVFIKRFVGLRSLKVADCKQLEEILELPPKIEDIYASGCISLERFFVLSKGFQFDRFPRLEWIDLSICHKLLENVGNDVENLLLDEGHFEDHQFGIIYPGNKIPNWFCNLKETSNDNKCEIDIYELSHLDGEITGIAMCVVIGIKSGQIPVQALCNVEIIINGLPRYSDDKAFHLSGSDPVWFLYHVPEFNELKGDNLQVKFWSPTSSVSFKSCGAHLVRRYEEKAEGKGQMLSPQHGGVLHENVGVRNENIENSVDLMDGIQHTKRRHDDDDDGDGNFESNWYPRHKRFVSTMGIRISDAEDTATLSESQLHQPNHPTDTST
ncbi:disease resistance protein RUN1-like [Corylus avellana]|uniref:disease resistance protein RUN1-like n=1 Tax=Corylus avellana TaxID=13451 RepID=UPI00286BD6A7|nr:disease resistance protein RUN1-like [Corylus avellana]